MNFSHTFSRDENINLWSELDYVDPSKVKVWHWGSATILVPQFFTNAIVRASQQMSIHEFQYTETFGTDSLKQSIAENFCHLARYKNISPEKNIIISSGANYLMEIMLKFKVKEHDDEVLFIEPFYSYHFAAMKGKGVAVFSKMKFDQETKRFELDFDDIAKKLSHKTKAVVICNPHNPTSRVFTEDEYRKLSKIFSSFPNLIVIEDAAYCVYLSDGTKLVYFHEIDNNFDRCVTLFSGGKIFNTTGMRTGWMVGPEKIVSSVKSHYVDTFPNSCLEQRIFQYALKDALNPFEGFSNFWEYIREDIDKRGVYFTSQMEAIGIPVVTIEGTYYGVINIEKLIQAVEPEYYYKIDRPEEYDPHGDKALARKLLKIFQIAVVPFSSVSFIRPREERFFRISLNRDWGQINLVIAALKELASQAKMTISETP